MDVEHQENSATPLVTLLTLTLPVMHCVDVSV